MPLRLELKPFERLIINGALLRNGERRSTFLIETQCKFLRESEIITESEADTACKQLHLTLTVIYLADDPAQGIDLFFRQATDLIRHLRRPRRRSPRSPSRSRPANTIGRSSSVESWSNGRVRTGCPRRTIRHPQKPVEDRVSPGLPWRPAATWLLIETSVAIFSAVGAIIVSRQLVSTNAPRRPTPCFTSTGSGFLIRGGLRAQQGPDALVVRQRLVQAPRSLRRRGPDWHRSGVARPSTEAVIQLREASARCGRSGVSIGGGVHRRCGPRHQSCRQGRLAIAVADQELRLRVRRVGHDNAGLDNDHAVWPHRPAPGSRRRC